MRTVESEYLPKTVVLTAKYARAKQLLDYVGPIEKEVCVWGCRAA
jgi:hypothetical protein